MAPERVVLHPLVLLSVVDHYNRVAKGSSKRIVGILLGNTRGGVVDVANSFAGNWPRLASLLIQYGHSSIRGGLPRSIHMVLGPQLSREHLRNVQKSERQGEDSRLVQLRLTTVGHMED